MLRQGSGTSLRQCQIPARRLAAVSGWATHRCPPNKHNRADMAVDETEPSRCGIVRSRFGILHPVHRQPWCCEPSVASAQPPASKHALGLAFGSGKAFPIFHRHWSSQPQLSGDRSGTTTDGSTWLRSSAARTVAMRGRRGVRSVRFTGRSHDWHRRRLQLRRLEQES